VIRATASGARPPALLAAAGLAVVALLALPLVYLVLRAVGGDAWDVLRSDSLWSLIRDTGVLVVAVTATTLALGVPLAWLVVRTDLPGRRIWGTAAALPLVVPSYVAALVLLAAFGPRGMLQQLLEPLGVDRVPEIYGLPGAWLALTLSTYPFVFLLAASAMSSLDPALEDAARGLGRSRGDVFRTVTLPVLRP
jgi:iron(III) transport system permease protein